MKPMLIAYAVNDGIDMLANRTPPEITHINLAFGTIDKGLLSLKGLSSLHKLPLIRKQNPKVKILLSIGGWGAGGFSNMAKRAEGIKAFAESCLDALNQYGLDGIDIDWEYPCHDEAGIDAAPEDRVNFTALLSALRALLPKPKLLSIAAGAGDYFIRDTEIEKVAALCDYIQLMTYDMRGGFTQIAGHHTGLYPIPEDPEGMYVSRCVESFAEAGVPKDKLVIGAAFYSRLWQGLSNPQAGLMQKAESVGGYGPDYSALKAEYIDLNGWSRYFDERAQAPYLMNGRDLISYDDPCSIKAKCAYLLEQGLAGIMYWEHSCDRTGELLNSMIEGLKR